MPWSVDKHAIKLFSILGNVDLNAIPNLRQSCGATSTKILCFGPCQNGPIDIDFFIPKSKLFRYLV
jgi:hypothetical protein